MSLTSASSRSEPDWAEDPVISVDEHMEARALHWQEAASIMAPVAAIVAEMHAHGELHLDLDPMQIRLNVVEGTVHLDGSADEHPLAHPSLNFTAPERFRDLAPGPEADVYSLGALLLHLVSGAVPFAGQNNNGPAATMARITEHPVPLHTLPSDVPEAMVELIGLSMRKSPAKRQLTAQHFSDVADALAKGDEVLIVRAPQPDPDRADAAAASLLESESSMRTLVLGLTLFLVLIVGGAGLGVLVNQPEAQAGAALAQPGEVEPVVVDVAGAVEATAPPQPTPVAEQAVTVRPTAVADTTSVAPRATTPPAVTEPSTTPARPSTSSSRVEPAPQIVVLTQAVPDDFEVRVGEPVARSVLANDSVPAEQVSVGVTGAGALPLGLRLGADGALVGTPLECGTFEIGYRIESVGDSVGTSRIRVAVTGCGEG